MSNRIASPRDLETSRPRRHTPSCVWAAAFACIAGAGLCLWQQRQADLDRGLADALRHARYAEARGLLGRGADANARIVAAGVHLDPLREIWHRIIGRPPAPPTGDPPLLVCRPPIERSRRAAILSDADERERATTLEALIRHGADVDAVTESGLTLLQTAASQGDGTLTAVLLAHGASQRPSPDTPPPLTLALGPPVRMLIDHGADVNSLFVPTQRTFALIDDPDPGLSPLTHAVNVRDGAAIRLLLERGATPDTRTLDARAIPGKATLGTSAAPLLDACLDEPALLRLFWARYGDIDRRLSDGQTLLEEVVADEPEPILAGYFERKMAAVRLLLERGADPNAKDRCGRSALSEAGQLEANVSHKLALARRYRDLIDLLQRAAAGPWSRRVQAGRR